jgi:hypothetical protein
MLEHADTRSRALILLLASTGMRIGAIPGLNIEDLKPMKTGDTKLYAITVYRNEIEQYVTFASPEATKAIDNYIDFRKRIKEPLKPSSPLIRNDVDIESAENNPDYRLPKRMRTDGLRHIIEKIIEGSGLKSSLSTTIQTKKAIRYEAHLTRALRKLAKIETSRIEIANEQMTDLILKGHSFEEAQKTANLETIVKDMNRGNPIETHRALLDAYKKSLLADIEQVPPFLQAFITNWISEQEAQFTTMAENEAK